MNLFGERIISKSQLQRAALTYGKIPSAKSTSDVRRHIIQSEVAEYSSAEGGRWNYDDLFSGLVQLARGADIRMLQDYFSGLKGKGEAVSKSTLLEEVLAKTPIKNGQVVEVGARRLALGSDVYLPLAYDLSILHDAAVYCFFIYPRRTPLKSKAKNAIINEFSAPFEGMSRAHKLLFVENPIVANKRMPSTELLDFEFRAIDMDFREHLRVSRLAMEDE